jgi:hypothetical protein
LGGKLLSAYRPGELHYCIHSANHFTNACWSTSDASHSLDRSGHVTDTGQRFDEGSSANNTTVRTVHKIAYTGYAHYSYAGTTGTFETMTDTVFVTSSNVDFGFTEIVLTVRSANHIMIGHRDIGTLPITLLKEAIEKTTHVVVSSVPRRFVFLSRDVTTASGRPIAVIVERPDSAKEASLQGKIITATWKDDIRGKMVWESNNGLYSSFDDQADILYISRGSAVVSYAVEDEINPDI